jgi:hypothetical protein
MPNNIDNIPHSGDVGVYDMVSPMDVDGVHDSIELVQQVYGTTSMYQNFDFQDMYTLARFESLQDDQYSRRPSRNNANTDVIAVDRLTRDNEGDIVAFVYCHDADTDIQRVYPSFIWDPTSNMWEQMEMPDQILERDGDNWHMYNDSVSAGQVTLSYENLPNNMPPVPGTY